MTRAGAILGTASYMSHEQSRGKPAEKSTDIWAFGRVLYEVLPGKKALSGPNETHQTASDILASVLTQDPDWDQLPVDLAQGIGRLLLRTLDKEPRNRLHDIADIRIELEEEETSYSEVNLQKTATVRKQWSKRLPCCLAVFFLCITILLLVIDVWKKSVTTSEPAVGLRLGISLPDHAPLAPASSTPLGRGAPSITISPDGSYLAYFSSARPPKMPVALLKKMLSDRSCLG